MAKTAQMKLMELLVMKQDVSSVIHLIGKKESFQFYFKKQQNEDDNDITEASEQYKNLLGITSELKIDSSEVCMAEAAFPTEEEKNSLKSIISSYESIKIDLESANRNFEKISSSLKEAQAFSGLNVSYSELDHLSYIVLKIGKIPVDAYDELKASLADNAVLVPLSEDKTHILVTASKKSNFALDSVLKNFGFVEIQIPKDFKGVPEDMLSGLENQLKEIQTKKDELLAEKNDFAQKNKEQLLKLWANFALANQVSEVEEQLESTETVYRITGWIPSAECENYMKSFDEITEGRVAIRVYEPYEVPAVINGKEEIPVKVEHKKFVKSFERMIFSYGAPIYGTIDPTPFVAIFFTFLFGFMFGDLGQGLVILLIGILMATKVVKFGGWGKFGPIFIAVGCTSSIMGLLTGEIFSNETLLEPFSMWLTGLFGHPHAPILHLMPSKDPNSIKVMFGVFGVAVAVGFVINSIGLVINMINNFIQKKWAEVFFGKNGLSGAIFYWYVIALLLRIFLFHHSIAVYDWIIIGVSLFFASFAAPFERIIEHEKPFKDGFGAYLIGGVVELIEVFSGYLSNTISFVRVGAFALSHAVLDYMILILTEMCGGPLSIGGIFVLIIGNAIVIVLEGMIVAIQVIRLQYYEFFSKFFHETGKEFKPFKFEINK